MTPRPRFRRAQSDADGRRERERLRRVHDLLVVAGPPPELTPQMEAGPTLAMTIGGRGSRRRVQRRVALLAAAIVVLLLAFLGGLHHGQRPARSSGQLLKLQGTAAAPNAQASLRVEDVDAAGNWPMQLAALGLPKLPPKGYYEVFLVREREAVGTVRDVRREEREGRRLGAAERAVPAAAERQLGRHAAAAGRPRGRPGRAPAADVAAS